MTCMHAGEVFDWTPPADPPCCLAVVSFLVVLVVWFFRSRRCRGVDSRFVARVFLFFLIFVEYPLSAKSLKDM